MNSLQIDTSDVINKATPPSIILAERQEKEKYFWFLFYKLFWHF